MPRAKQNNQQSSFLENYGHTAPAVPAIREAVREWRASRYKGATEISRTLLNYWFNTDHKQPSGLLFRYHFAQQEAVESLIYVYEVAGARSQQSLYERFIPAELETNIRLPEYDSFARYCTKMATGSGKTKVMSLAIAWQYFNAVADGNPDYASTFLILAPNVIVFERLRSDFAGGRIFKADPVIPKDLQTFWEMQFYMRGEAERASSLGALYLTNVQQIYTRPDITTGDDEPDAMTAVLGAKPPANNGEYDNFPGRIAARSGDGRRVMVLNDEAHHTHEDGSAWNSAIRDLSAALDQPITIQHDFSATPRYGGGGLFAWTISDYTLKQAILEGIVKRPLKGLTDIGEVPSDVPAIRYEPFITAGVERWREYREALSPLGKKPLLFLMLNDTDEADQIGDYLRKKYPDEFGGHCTLIIHTKRDGEIAERDLDLARKAAAEVDRDDSPVNAIVSVLMLREGWDVQNVTVVVGLRPYSSKANILPEQTIGRGLRLMFRGLNTPYQERVDIIGNKGFIRFIEQLEAEEDYKLDTFQLGTDRLIITTIQPEAERAEYDIALPILSPILTRATSLEDEIAGIDAARVPISAPLPRKKGSQEERSFHYEGQDILTLEKLIDRSYTIPTPQTSGEIIAYFAQIIAADLKLPSHFAALAPKVRDFLTYRAYGQTVDLDTPEMLSALALPLVRYVVVQTFVKLLRDTLIRQPVPTLENAGRALSELRPFPWSQQAPICAKTVFNKVPCDNHFEEDFARFLDKAADVIRYAKLPMLFGFTIPYVDNASNLRHYYPDFVVADAQGTYWLVETKGREDTDVQNKDRSASIWAQQATMLTGQAWGYLKVLQADFEKMQPNEFSDCVHVGAMQTQVDFDFV